MMSLGLCMTVKNEAARLPNCLDGIYDLFDQIEVIDTGSSDQTVALLHSKYGITARQGRLQQERCYTLSDLRNEGFARLQTDWVLCLDADEFIEREELIRFICHSHAPHIDGYFCRWTTAVIDHSIEDYKLSLFRNGYQKLGLVHDNIQVSFRQHGAQAQWYDDLTIWHNPPRERTREKHQYYEWRLRRAIELDTDWPRYHWFLGYRLFCDGRVGESTDHLLRCFNSQSTMFPVEVLNSAMILIAIYSEQGRPIDAEPVLHRAHGFLQKHRDDFEVRVNFRLADWFTASNVALNDGKPIKPYSFAY